MNRVERGGGGVPYQFTDGKKIKKIYATAQLQTELVRGRLAIARLDDGYELLPASAARKIMQRDEAAVILLNESEPAAPGEEDPYAGYEIPDDLMW